TYCLEGTDRYQSVVSMIDPAFQWDIAMQRATVSKDRILCQGDRTLKTVPSDRMHANNDGISPCPGLHVQQTFTKPCWIPRMRVGTNEEIEVAAMHLNCSVHPGTLNPLWIVHKYDAVVACHVIPSNGTAAISAPPISNDNCKIDIICVGQ